jgi:small subunit ribosomal protein S8
VLKNPAGKNMLQSTSIDFLIRIKNAVRAGKKSMTAPASNFCVSIADLLKRYGFITNYSLTSDTKPCLSLDLSYEKVSSLPWGKTPQSLIIISTSAGVMSQKEAKTKKLGGEIIAEVY